MNPETTDEYIENDKIYAPFLLAASTLGLIEFIGSYIKDGILYWKFRPRNECLTLITQLTTQGEPRIPAKILFNSIETFWKQISSMRNEGMRYGRQKS